MMLPSDLFLIADPEFKKWVEVYSKDEARFNKDFGKFPNAQDALLQYFQWGASLTLASIPWLSAAAFGKLLALGVPGLSVGKPWYQFW